MIGKPTHFDPHLACDVAEQMIEADEIERAFLLLDNFPAYYRQHPTDRMREIRCSLHRQLWTPVQYKNIYAGTEDLDPDMGWAMRYHLVEQEVRAVEDRHVHLTELAPGAFTLPKGLAKHGLIFTYEHQSVDDYDFAHPREAPRDAFNIFCAFELIEHLSNEWEIYQNYLKFGRDADIVMISTPLFTYGGGMGNWRARELGHLRTYSPNELHASVSAMFLGYSWECATDDTIVLTGRKVNTLVK